MFLLGLVILDVFDCCYNNGRIDLVLVLKNEVVFDVFLVDEN